MNLSFPSPIFKIQVHNNRGMSRSWDTWNLYIYFQDDDDDENRIFAARQHLERARVKNVFHYSFMTSSIQSLVCSPTQKGQIFFSSSIWYNFSEVPKSPAIIQVTKKSMLLPETVTLYPSICCWLPSALKIH